MQPSIQHIEEQLRRYAQEFVRAEYGEQATANLIQIQITAVDAYDTGGVSEATETNITLAAKRDITAGRLTSTTKLILRHELGHVIQNDQAFGEFEEEIQRERTAWVKAKPRNAAEHWYKSVSIRTHLDPLKMQSVGFPRPETKLLPWQLERGTVSEVKRMKKNSVWVDELLAKRFAMANLIENPHYYDSTA